jgi:hypothetical protein
MVKTIASRRGRCVGGGEDARAKIQMIMWSTIVGSDESFCENGLADMSARDSYSSRVRESDEASGVRLKLSLAPAAPPARRPAGRRSVIIIKSSVIGLALRVLCTEQWQDLGFRSASRLSNCVAR